MLLRMSTLFLRTLREDPADAEVPSHRLLVRAGYIRRAGSGAFTYLPLGRLVLDNVARIVKEEMAAIGSQEVLFPAMLPREPYDRSGRWREYGQDMFRLRDRRGADHLLAPTHEEMFTLLVRDLYASYRDFPVLLYQVQTKYRDEQRPRAGLLRGREFLMKDGYSFDLDDAGLARSYASHREAYQRIFARLCLEVTAVAATSGAMGGSASEEFLATAQVGEDTFVACQSCGYAANTEAVRTSAGQRAPNVVEHPAWTVLETPDTPTIDSLVARLNDTTAGGRVDWTAANTLKNIVVRLSDPDGGAELVVIGVPGDREVDLKRLEAAVYPRGATLAEASDFADHPDLVRGYIGPQLLAKIGVRYLADPRITPGTAWVTGANEPGRHAIDVVCGRDFTPDGPIDVAEIRSGDPCPSCAGPLAIRRGVEVGHIFQLGTKYSDVFGLDALGANGKQTRITMGSYGIGISRAMATIVEQHHDDRGIVWPAALAPCDVHLVPTGAQQFAIAQGLAEELEGLGYRVLLDDRQGISAGVRFIDSELLGMPHTVVIGRRAAEGYGELRVRATGARGDVPLGDIAERIRD